MDAYVIGKIRGKREIVSRGRLLCGTVAQEYRSVVVPYVNGTPGRAQAVPGSILDEKIVAHVRCIVRHIYGAGPEIFIPGRAGSRIPGLPVEGEIYRYRVKLDIVRYVRLNMELISGGGICRREVLHEGGHVVVLDQYPSNGSIVHISGRVSRRDVIVEPVGAVIDLEGPVPRGILDEVHG